MLAKITRGSQIVIPKEIIRKAQLGKGCDYVDVEYSNGQIHLKPVEVEERISPEQYEKIIRWAAERKKRDRVFESAGSALRHLRARVKKHR